MLFKNTNLDTYQAEISMGHRNQVTDLFLLDQVSRNEIVSKKAPSPPIKIVASLDRITKKLHNNNNNNNNNFNLVATKSIEPS